MVFNTDPENTTSSANIILVEPILSNNSDICFICLSTEFLSSGAILETKFLLLSRRVQSRNIIDSLFVSRYILSSDTMGIPR